MCITSIISIIKCTLRYPLQRMLTYAYGGCWMVDVLISMINDGYIVTNNQCLRATKPWNGMI